MVTVAINQELCSAGAREFVSKLRADPALEPCMPVLVDATGVSGVSIDRAGIKAVVDVLEATANPAPGQSRTAIVVHKTGLALLADLFAASVTNRGLKHHVRAFPDAEEARHWLNEASFQV